jgi:hypothetical protein
MHVSCATLTGEGIFELAGIVSPPVLSVCNSTSLLKICVSFGFKTYQLWQRDIQKENIKHAKGNECSQYKIIAAIFSSSLSPCFN